MLLNGITDNVIKQIIKSLLGSFSKSHQIGIWLVCWKQNLVNVIIHLLGSDMVGPKVIPLSGTYCSRNNDSTERTLKTVSSKKKKCSQYSLQDCYCIVKYKQNELAVFVEI